MAGPIIIFHVSWGCNARPFGRIVNTSDAREGHLHGRPAGGARCSAKMRRFAAIFEIIFWCLAEERKFRRNGKENATIREFSTKWEKK